MLALCYELNKAGIINNDFISRYTVGFKEFLSYLNGSSDGTIKSADWASKIIGINKKVILKLVDKIKNSERTMISVSWSLTRQAHGEQPFWAAIALASIIGDIGKPGGGIGFGYSAMNSIGNHYKKIPAVSLPQEKIALRSLFPSLELQICLKIQEIALITTAQSLLTLI